MNEILKKINKFFTINKIDDKNYFILSPFYFMGSLTTFPLKITFNEKNIILSDNGGILEFLDEQNKEFNPKFMENILKKLNIKFEKSVFYTETSVDTFDFDLANFIQLISSISLV